MNITQNDYNVLKQSVLNKYVKVEILDFNYFVVDEISGNCISCSVSINADSDLRRSCNISLVVNNKKFDVAPGSEIWLDKYFKVYIGYENNVTNETQWYNQGIYLINKPNFNYDASTNTLSFSGLDLMSKLTGLRNGNLEGIPHVITQGSDVRSVIIDTLKLGGFNQYLIDNCMSGNEIVPVPYDITIDTGGTLFDILSKLRDIIPKYQMYFDENGIFHYNQIPTNYNTPILIDDDLLNNLLISKNISTDFESVKNYIEVYGATHEIENYSTSTTVSDNVVNLTIPGIQQVDPYDMLGFSINSELSATKIVVKVNGESQKTLVDVSGNNVTHIKSGLNVIICREDGQFWYLGGSQAVGIAYDDNENSPFNINGSVGRIRIVLSGGEYDNIMSDDLAIQRAQQELYWRCRVNDSITLSVVPIPWIDVNNVIEYEGKKYLIKTINMDYSSNSTMNINAMSFYDYYG